MKTIGVISAVMLALIPAIFFMVSLAALAHAAAATTATTTIAAATSSISLQQQIDANNQQIVDLNQQIAQYQTELQQVGADKKTLQQAIHALDLQLSETQTQVKATQLQIGATQLQIQQLGGEIVDTNAAIATNQTALGEYLRNLQKDDGQSLLIRILSTENLAEIWSDANATLEMQQAIQGKVQTLHTQEGALTDSQTASQQKQTTLTLQQKSLASQQKSLTTTEQSKNQLLVETNSKEANYEKLLATAEAQLKSFSTFAQNAGGSKLLGNQTACDAWGCYYNQRDTAWGNTFLNGTQYTLASDGCLVTAMAMVMTHYGYKDVTPATINGNPNNFAAYYPAYLLLTINVDGVTATRKTTAIDATLATGNPVIVGLNAYGGTHYVVLVSGSSGHYIMRDPYIANGDDVSFSASYSMRNIFGISRVIITS